MMQGLKINQLSLIKTGKIYIFGRDKNFYPNIYINLNSDLIISKNIILDCLKFLIILTRQYVCLPYHCEYINLIIFAENDIDFEFIKKIILLISNTLTEIFPYFINKIFIHSSRLKEEEIFTNNEFIEDIIVKMNDIKILKEYIDDSQLEKKYNGLYENLNNFWPPINTYSENSLVSENTENITLFNLIGNKKFLNINDLNNSSQKNTSFDPLETIPEMSIYKENYSEYDSNIFSQKNINNFNEIDNNKSEIWKSGYDFKTNTEYKKYNSDINNLKNKDNILLFENKKMLNNIDNSINNIDSNIEEKEISEIKQHNIELDINNNILEKNNDSNQLENKLLENEDKNIILENEDKNILLENIGEFDHEKVINDKEDLNNKNIEIISDNPVENNNLNLLELDKNTEILDEINKDSKNNEVIENSEEINIESNITEIKDKVVDINLEDKNKDNIELNINLQENNKIQDTDVNEDKINVDENLQKETKIDSENINDNKFNNINEEKIDIINDESKEKIDIIKYENNKKEEENLDVVESKNNKVKGKDFLQEFLQEIIQEAIRLVEEVKNKEIKNNTILDDNTNLQKYDIKINENNIVQSEIFNTNKILTNNNYNSDIVKIQINKDLDSSQEINKNGIPGKNNHNINNNDISNNFVLTTDINLEILELDEENFENVNAEHIKRNPNKVNTRYLKKQGSKILEKSVDFMYQERFNNNKINHSIINTNKVEELQVEKNIKKIENLNNFGKNIYYPKIFNANYKSFTIKPGSKPMSFEKKEKLKKINKMNLWEILGCGFR